MGNKNKVKVKVLQKVKTDNQIRQDAVDSILEKGVDFTITVQNKSIFNKLHLAPVKKCSLFFQLKWGHC